MEPWREDTRFVLSITIKPLQKWYTGVPWPIYHDMYGLNLSVSHLFFHFKDYYRRNYLRYIRYRKTYLDRLL